MEVFFLIKLNPKEMIIKQCAIAYLGLCEGYIICSNYGPKHENLL